MKIAIITPYFKESLDILEQCYNSVLEQEVNTDHYFIADGPSSDKAYWYPEAELYRQKDSSDNWEYVLDRLENNLNSIR